MTLRRCLLTLLLALTPSSAFLLRRRPPRRPGQTVFPKPVVSYPDGAPLDAAPHRFGFVCGVHFSGTSILHYALGLNPEVSIMRVAPLRQDEGQAFQDVMPTALQMGARALRGAGVNATGLLEVGRYFALTPDWRWSEADATPQRAQRLRQQWEHLWDTRRRILVEKSPPDLIRMRFLAAVFPPAFFVVIVRHPLAVCRRTQWRLRLLCMHTWVNGYEWALEDIAAGNLTAYVTFYEMWASQPLTELAAMTPLLGLRDPAFDWAAVVQPGEAKLKSHARAGWGYSGPLGAAGTPDVSSVVYVDASVLLPDPSQSIARFPNPQVRARFEALEGRINAFGYSFYPPFVTGCREELRRVRRCPPRGRRTQSDGD